MEQRIIDIFTPVFIIVGVAVFITLFILIDKFISWLRNEEPITAIEGQDEK